MKRITNLPKENCQKVETISPPEVTAYNTEVKSGTVATISCVIEQLTSKLEVKWLGDDGIEITDDANYRVKPPAFDGNRQTEILVVKKDAVDQDRTFTCRVRSTQFSESPSYDTDVQIIVYGIITRNLVRN